MLQVRLTNLSSMFSVPVYIDYLLLLFSNYIYIMIGLGIRLPKWVDIPLYPSVRVKYVSLSWAHHHKT